jgi:FtsP/CotA-like multicopper oxidase with cupredoxin domain
MQGLASCGASSESFQSGDLPVLDKPSSVTISIEARQVQWVPGVPPARDNAWVYVAHGATAASGVLPNHLGATFEVRRGSACSVTWSNAIPAAPGSSQLLLSDPPNNPPPVSAICGKVLLQSPVGVATHLHGARVNGGSDGWPLTPLGFANNPYGFSTSKTFDYPNAQRATMLWYHDHAMDRTGLHVHAGLAGLYFIRDSNDDTLLRIVGGLAREVPLVIQDRILTADRTGIDYSAGMIDGVNGPSRPEFMGTMIFVNGHPAAVQELERRPWRLRILNACNTRTVGLALCDPDALQAGSGRIWYSDALRLVGADGGLISRSIGLNATDILVIAPAQRRDVLLDLSTVPSSVKRLRLVNVALRYFIDSGRQNPEAIFTTAENSLLRPTSQIFSASDLTLYGALDSAVSDVMRIDLADPVGFVPALTATAIDALLSNAATDDDFAWDGSRLNALADSSLGPNRLVLLMSNTEGYDASEVAHGISGWSDVQIFEMQPDGNDWTLPFKVDLDTTTSPAPGAPSAAQTGYTIARRTFFANASSPDITTTKTYPDVHSPTITARAGTYERWYVANIGNSQPLNRVAGDPDMHPFHIHLVNFVVTRRWQLDDDQATGSLIELSPGSLDLDLVARQDTVMIPSGQLVELLVHYPVGFSGDYAYHCHLLEHEDKCMMSHFNLRDEPIETSANSTNV